MRGIAVLGSTGSIGRQALGVMRAHGLKPAVLTANRNSDMLEAQARLFKPDAVCLADETAAAELKLKLADTPVRVLAGRQGVIETARMGDTVLNALVGISGLEPTLAAIDEGHNVLLANKEALVCGGHLVMSRAAEKGVSVLPVDSEHSAIFQCLQAGKQGLKRLILTASGGAFLGWDSERLKTVTPEMALKHPNWSMGAKVTVDSATLMNKGLEYIEAMWLFGAPEISVMIHPQSIIHSMIEYDDGAVIAQLGVPDMRLPIQYAMLYPERALCPVERLDLCKIGSLTFFEPDTDAFPCLRHAMLAAEKGGNAGAVLNAADESAVAAFLEGKIGFTRIPGLIERALEHISWKSEPSLDDILETHKEVLDFLR